MRQYDRITGILSPQRTDDLRPEVLPFIGREIVFLVGWEIESGDYTGQWALLPQSFAANDDLIAFGFGWVPQCDVKINSEEVA